MRPWPRLKEQVAFGVCVGSTKYNLEEEEGRYLLPCACAFGIAQCVHLAYISKYGGSNKTSRDAVRQGGVNAKSVGKTLENRVWFCLWHP